MNVDKKVLAVVKKSFAKFDFSRLDEKCTDEAKTRAYLIEPMCEMIGYSRIDDKDMLTEINAGWGNKTNKADIGLIIKGKKPEIIIECKKLGMKLTDKEGAQLDGYFGNTEGSKIGILTNGIEWRFYAEYLEKNKLHPNPFLIIDFTEINDTKIEEFAQFHKNFTKIDDILVEAQETFFLEGFNLAFTDELLNPSDDFIKAIFNRMPGKRITDSIKEKLQKLINSNTIQQVLPKLIEEESKSGDFIITTGEELKIYHAVKTIIINSLKKIDFSRISYRDQKNSFNILVDDNQRKLIAKITSNKGKYFLEITGNGDKKIQIDGLESVVAHSKSIIEIAKSYFTEIK
ncbi:MAG: type I restriction enzyme HsdR N-terminal domain-containing protein [Bacteroidetes bacterium]|nr:type I restriction enzyme HsdR N-terminal domain-containing protein [Bacteroidota bacterium]